MSVPKKKEGKKTNTKKLILMSTTMNKSALAQWMIVKFEIVQWKKEKNRNEKYKTKIKKKRQEKKNRKSAHITEY